MEVERIYQDMCKADIRSVAITSATDQEGVTSIAQALTQRFLLSGHTTVLVDLNLHRPNLNTVLSYNNVQTPSVALGTPSLVSCKDSHASIIGITVPTQRAVILKLRNPGELEKCIKELHTMFDYIIFDTNALNRVNKQNIPAERVAAACDGCYMVVLAGVTEQKYVYSAVSKLSHSRANLIGCIVNDMCNPPLRTELIRECQRLRPALKSIANWLEAKILKIQFLNTEE